MKEQTTTLNKNIPASNYHVNALEALVNLLQLKNYSENTIKNYPNWFLYFLKHFPERKPSTIKYNEIESFLLQYRKSKSWSSTSQNQLINSIKFFYEHVLKQPTMSNDLPRANKNSKLPVVFDEKEIASIIKGN